MSKKESTILTITVAEREAAKKCKFFLEDSRKEVKKLKKELADVSKIEGTPVPCHINSLYHTYGD